MPKMENIKEGIGHSFEWKIPDFFSLSQEVDTFYKSPDFKFVDATWFLAIYPNGQSDIASSIGWVSLYLALKRLELPEIVVDHTFGVREIDGKKYRAISLKGTYARPGENFGLHKFLQRSKLLSDRSRMAPNGILTIFCTLSIDWKTSALKSAQQKPTLTSAKKLLQNYRTLLLSKEGSDVTLKVGDQKFHAHKTILQAQPPVFCAMFKHDTAERNSVTVDIHDCEPSSFQDFLLYLYSETVEKMNKSNVIGLLTAAHKYNVNDLKATCIQFMVKNMSVENFCEYFALALLYNELTLLETGKMFFTANSKKIIVTNEWQLFKKENPGAAIELNIKSLNNKLIPDRKKIYENTLAYFHVIKFAFTVAGLIYVCNSK